MTLIIMRLLAKLSLTIEQDAEISSDQNEISMTVAINEVRKLKR